MKNSRSLLLLLTSLVIVTCSVNTTQAATHYIDYVGGSDVNSGTSPSAPWKHVPGDDSATGNPGSLSSFNPGDSILFRGGVIYRGKFRFISSGVNGNPIVYKGDDWGTGKAIIDGSRNIEGPWIKCTSPTDCEGNIHWNDIYYTFLTAPPAAMSHRRWLSLNAYQDTARLFAAYYPNPSNRFNFDNVAEHRNPQNVTSTYLEDAKLDSFDGPSMRSSYLYVYCGNNTTMATRIDTFIQSLHRAVFDSQVPSPYTGSSARYLLANNLKALDVPGEWFYSEVPESNGTHKFYLWPYSDPGQSTISYSVHPFILDANDCSYDVLDGFELRKASGNDGRTVCRLAYNDASGMVFKNDIFSNCFSVKSGAALYMNDYRHFIFQNNYLYDNMFLRGLDVVNTDPLIKDEDNRILNNTFEKQGGTALSVDGNARTYIVGNVIKNNTGVHTNGISPYQECRNVLVANNLVYNTPRPLTLNTDSGTVIYNNIFHGNENTWVLSAGAAPVMRGFIII